ncbi:MAG: hypothetical protein WAN48_08305 [Actinomycetes bacterium]
MSRVMLVALLCAVPLALTACGDGTPPSREDVSSALSSVASQGSDAASSLTASPTPTPTPTPTLTKTAPATETTTATATATVTKTPQAPTTASTTATPAAEAATSESTVSPWAWALVALLVVVLGFSLVMLARRRASKKRWDADFAAAAGSAKWINDTYIPSLLALGTADQLEQSWLEGATRINDVDNTLFQLETQAPDPDRATSVTNARTSLAALRQALQRVVDLAAAGADGDSQRQAAASVQGARAGLSNALVGLTDGRRSARP